MTSEQAEIEARKKKAERGWIAEPPRPRPQIGAGEEIATWYRVIGIKGREKP